jgi:hypothetical protein
VAIDYDAQRKEPILCRVCKHVALCYGNICPACALEYRKLHPAKRDRKYVPKQRQSAPRLPGAH